MVGECQWLSSWFEDCDYEIIEIIKKVWSPTGGKYETLRSISSMQSLRNLYGGK